MLGKLEKLPGEPIVVRTITQFGSEADMKAAAEVQNKLLDEQREPVFFILDMTNAQLNFDDLATAVNMAARLTRLFQHPNIREILGATSNRMVVLAGQNLDNDIYGNVKTKIFSTVEEALSYARAKK